MELRQLRHFVAAAEEGNISRAARRIFLTQSALSRQIRVLEEEIGECLFERQAHSIRLTAAGEALLPEARALLEHADEVRERMRSLGRGARLRVGYSPSLAAGMLSAATAVFTQAHPNARVELLDLSTNEMLSGLEEGRIDVAITVGDEVGRRGFQWTPLLRAPWKLAVRRDHPLARRSLITPAEVAREPLLGFSRSDYPEYWAMLGDWLRKAGERPRLRGEYDGVDSLMAAVESGQGVALVATRKGRLIPKHVRLKPLSPSPDPLCIAAGYRADRSQDKPLLVFIEELRRAAGESP